MSSSVCYYQKANHGTLVLMYIYQLFFITFPSSVLSLLEFNGFCQQVVTFIVQKILVHMTVTGSKLCAL